MNNIQECHIDIMRDTILTVQNKISRILNKANSFDNALDEIVNNFENIGIAASQVHLKGLASVCQQFSKQISNFPLSNDEEAEITYEYVDSWLQNILFYLNNIHSEQGIEQLISDLESNKDEILVLFKATTVTDDVPIHISESILNQDSLATEDMLDDSDELDDSVITEMIDNEIALDNSHSLINLDSIQEQAVILDEKELDIENMLDDSDELDDTIVAKMIEEDENRISNPRFDLEDSNDALDIDLDLDSMLADDEIDLSNSEGIMALLCQELSELQADITSLSNEISKSGKESSKKAAQSYTEIIERIHSTSSDLGLSGLVQVCEFIEKNINLALELDDDFRKKTQTVLAGWPQIIIDHLQAPADDKLCLAVVDYLESSAWPEPLKYNEIRDLINGLTKQLELTGDYEVEERSTVANLNDVSLSVDSDASQQLLDAFFAESPTHAEALTMHISNITQGIDIEENTKAAQRISHTLKGSANLIGTKGIANLAHHLEDIFEYLVKKSLMPPEPLAYTMQEAADVIEVMIESLQGISPEPTESRRILQDVLNWANRVDKGHLSRDTDMPLQQIKPTNKVDPNPSIDKNITSIGSNIVEQSNTISDEMDSTTSIITSQTEYLRVPKDTLDQVFNLIGETSIAIGQIQEELKRMSEHGQDMRKQEKTLQSRRFELENLVSIRAMASQQQRQAVTTNADFDSLEMDQYDEFYSATHSFIEAVSDTRESGQEISTHIMELNGLFLQQQRLNRSLQNLVMTTRLVPVKTIVARLQRIVRQACRTTGKQVKLKTIGDDLLIDGNVLNQLTDPLMHLLRNAIDHGIESPEERFEQGKSNQGNIILHFYQEGNSIRVNCSDDGAGLNYERIHDVAVKKGLLNSTEEASKSSLARIILNSGFSTRDVTTQLSGRGVGMDAVHNAILNLKGSIEIEDNLPAGTNFNLRLPITLLTSHSILVKTNDQKYAIPTSMLDQILPAGTGKFSTVGNKLSFQLGKDVYPAKSLAQLLGTEDFNSTSYDESNIVLLARFGTEVYAVMIEQVISNYELVVKNLGRYVKDISGIAGVALLGDGGVVPVLDLVELLNSHRLGKQHVIHRTNTDRKKDKLAKVLIVDDSLSVRKSLSQLVEDAGYEAILARDGIDALEVMQKTSPNLILTDLEMPRMTGIELTAHVRANSENKNLPIMMITSRTMSKHQEQAKKAGVDTYITKPFSEDDLVLKIGESLYG